MPIEVRTCEAGELAAAFAPISHYFGRMPTSEDGERWERILPPARMHAAWDDGAIVGGAGAYEFELTIPGGTVPAAGVLAVGVLPTHRRQGILTQLMRAQLDAVRERGEPVALLYASEGSIYGRFGYGIASFQGEIELAREHAAPAELPRREGAIRLVDKEEALERFPQVYDRVRVERPGMFARSRDWWEVRRLDPRSLTRQLVEPARALLEVDGEPVGYALYRVSFGMEYGASTSAVDVLEAIGATPAATRTIWRYLLTLDWMAMVRAGFLPLDHPLFFQLAEPRRMRFTVGEALWVRLVDLEAALSARSFRDGEPVVLDIVDEFCPENEGRWRMSPDGVERTQDPGELKLDARELGSVYLGGVTLDQLAQAGRIEELEPGAIVRADALFRTDRAPWCPELF